MKERRAMLLATILGCLCACQGPPGEARDGGGEGIVVGMALRDLTVEPNPRNVLSCFVTWTTNIPATSAVEFGPAGKRAWRVRGVAPVQRHRLLVIGLHEETEYTLRAVSGVPGGGTVSQTIRYTTSALPAHIPHGRITVHDRRRAYRGWTLMSVNAAKREGLIIYQDKDFTPTAVMYDMDGRPVWYDVHGLGRIGDTRFVQGDNVLAQSMADTNANTATALEIDLAGRIVWQGPDQPPLSVTDAFHHHFDKLASGNYLTVKSLQIGFVVGDVVVEMDRSRKEVWTWNAYEHLRPDTSRDNGEHFLYPWTHVNALVMDAKADALYINARNLSTVYKVRKSTGEILWALGKDGDFAADPAAEYPWFEQPHGLERLPNGNLIMYDNGLFKRGFARAVEYALDEQTLTTRIVWQYRGGHRGRWFVNYWGDADRLPNGNTLITAGTWKQQHHSRVFEVTSAGEVVWEMELPVRSETGNSVGVYNSERIKPPLLETIVW